MIDGFLDAVAGETDFRLTSEHKGVLIHGHCHQKALYGTSSMKSLLARVPGLEVTEVDSGCCGMAGSFGYEREHYDLSRTIGDRILFPAVREIDSDTRLLACGFSCRHQIEHFTGVKAAHFVELLRRDSSG